MNAVLRQGAAECADFVNIRIKLRHLPNVIIHAGFVLIQFARAGVGRFAEGVRAGAFPMSHRECKVDVRGRSHNGA